jgi:hypothetical protein
VDLAELVLDYIRVLIWPALVLLVVVRFRGGIRDFLERIAGESEEVSASGFGIQVSAKFQEKLAALAETSTAVDANDLRKSVREAAKELDREQFRSLTSMFTRLSPSQRQQAVRELERVTAGMTVDELMEFAGSPNPGERVGAAIGLRVNLQRSPDLANEPRFIRSVRALLGDESSFVRYRALEAVLSNEALGPQVEPEVRTLAETERNRQVRGLAERALAKIARQAGNGETE